MPFSGICTYLLRQKGGTRRLTAEVSEINAFKGAPRLRTSSATFAGRRIALLFQREAVVTRLQGQESLEPRWLSHFRRLLQKKIMNKTTGTGGPWTRPQRSILLRTRLRVPASTGVTVEDANDTHEKAKSYGKLYLFVKQPGGIVKTPTLQRVALHRIFAAACRQQDRWRRRRRWRSGSTTTRRTSGAGQ